ncbi:putative glyoxalase superfamily protein PhnB [Thermoflavifilum aggregans]|uniref:Putative glyoxalase superfamily protein PhnB n=1 Tax=Thermoflavifilum aggregans TaxID=454188 RepID=A0A2M9CSD2_9BACT|nr:VOC family protein [Thermoflavifilum aggregans]PJJ74803.1 putative glyoxalase superfamily protein PhnB [Thermoflavifilum aggregans]
MQKIPFKPKGMNIVNPYLIVENVQELINFTEQVFNAKLRYKLYRPNGQIMHAEILIGDSIVMAGEPMKDFGIFPCSLFLYIEDCDSVYTKALNYGCTSIMEPTTMRHAGERYGGVMDKNGNIWWIATHIENVSPEEQAKRIQEMKENWREE